MFEIGQKVRIKRGCSSVIVCNFVEYMRGYEGTEAVISSNNNGDNYSLLGNKWVWNESWLELVEEDKKTMTSIKEKFLLALTKEPQKSFRKAGITNGDDMLTTEGMGIFLTWLLNEKYADEFKTGVVDGLLEEDK
jgi:hypothetical protein